MHNQITQASTLTLSFGADLEPLGESQLQTAWRKPQPSRCQLPLNITGFPSIDWQIHSHRHVPACCRTHYFSNCRLVGRPHRSTLSAPGSLWFCSYRLVVSCPPLGATLVMRIYWFLV